MNITIKPLTSDLNEDYLDFFDNRAFTDDNPNGPCAEWVMPKVSNNRSKYNV